MKRISTVVATAVFLAVLSFTLVLGLTGVYPETHAARVDTGTLTAEDMQIPYRTAQSGQSCCPKGKDSRCVPC